MWGAPSVEISIYSTCKRISQKLLRNCVKFFYEVCKQDLAAAGFKVVRQNMEEIVLRGPGGDRDVRVVNSYPSKVGAAAAVSKVSLCAPRARRARAKSLPVCCARHALGVRAPKVCLCAARRADGARRPTASRVCLRVLAAVRAFACFAPF